MDGDVHVVHSHIPDVLSMNPKTRMVMVQHGSPEHIFETSVVQGVSQTYAPADTLALVSFFLRKSKAIITFWPRHAAIWETMTDRPIFCIPMGVKREFWIKQNIPPLQGDPAIFTAENAHNVKWPLDMFYMWPHLIERFPNGRLHSVNIPTDQHRWWWPIAYMNNARYTMFMSAWRFGPEELRNYLSAAPYYYSPVHYGDHNRISMEAASCGAKVISFEGNEYAHFWVREGDQRRQLEDLTAIFKGETPIRSPLDVPDSKDMAEAMVQVYKAVT
jgi:hypothetical protein